MYIYIYICIDYCICLGATNRKLIEKKRHHSPLVLCFLAGFISMNVAFPGSWICLICCRMGKHGINQCKHLFSCCQIVKFSMSFIAIPAAIKSCYCRLFWHTSCFSNFTMFQVSVVSASWALDPRGTNQARAWNSAERARLSIQTAQEKNSVEECPFNTWNTVTTVSFLKNYTDNKLHYGFTEVKVFILIQTLSWLMTCDLRKAISIGIQYQYYHHQLSIHKSFTINQCESLSTLMICEQLVRIVIVTIIIIPIIITYLHNHYCYHNF